MLIPAQGRFRAMLMASRTKLSKVSRVIDGLLPFRVFTSGKEANVPEFGPMPVRVQCEDDRDANKTTCFLTGLSIPFYALSSRG